MIPWGVLGQLGSELTHNHPYLFWLLSYSISIMKERVTCHSRFLPRIALKELRVTLHRYISTVHYHIPRKVCTMLNASLPRFPAKVWNLKKCMPTWASITNWESPLSSGPEDAERLFTHASVLPRPFAFNSLISFDVVTSMYNVTMM